MCCLDLCFNICAFVSKLVLFYVNWHVSIWGEGGLGMFSLRLYERITHSYNHIKEIAIILCTAWQLLFTPVSATHLLIYCNAQCEVVRVLQRGDSAAPSSDSSFARAGATTWNGAARADARSLRSPIRAQGFLGWRLCPEVQQGHTRFFIACREPVLEFKPMWGQNPEILLPILRVCRLQEPLKEWMLAGKVSGWLLYEPPQTWVHPALSTQPGRLKFTII